MRRSIARSLLLALTLFTQPLCADIPMGLTLIEVHVVDSAGEVIPSASVTLKNEGPEDKEAINRFGLKSIESGSTDRSGKVYFLGRWGQSYRIAAKKDERMWGVSSLKIQREEAKVTRVVLHSAWELPRGYPGR